MSTKSSWEIEGCLVLMMIICHFSRCGFWRFVPACVWFGSLLATSAVQKVGGRGVVEVVGVVGVVGRLFVQSQ